MASDRDLKPFADTVHGSHMVAVLMGQPNLLDLRTLALQILEILDQFVLFFFNGAGWVDDDDLIGTQDIGIGVRSRWQREGFHWDDVNPF